MCRCSGERRSILFFLSRRRPATRERLSSEGVRSSSRAFSIHPRQESSPPSLPLLLQGLPRSKTPQRCKLNLLAQSCTFWIRGKRPFKPLSKLPSLPSFSLSPPPGQRTYAGIGTRFKNILSRANFYLGRNLARLDVVI